MSEKYLTVSPVLLVSFNYFKRQTVPHPTEATLESENNALKAGKLPH